MPDPYVTKSGTGPPGSTATEKASASAATTGPASAPLPHPIARGSIPLSTTVFTAVRNLFRAVFGPRCVYSVNKNGGVSTVLITVHPPFSADYEPDITFTPTELYLNEKDGVQWQTDTGDDFEIEFVGALPFASGKRKFKRGDSDYVHKAPAKFSAYKYQLNSVAGKPVTWHGAHCPEIIIQK